MADENDVTEHHIASVIKRLRTGITQWNGLTFTMRCWSNRDALKCTPACLWGAAYFEACGEFPDKPPTENWLTSEYREGLYWLFMQGHLEPSQVVVLYDKLGADGRWSGFTLADCTHVVHRRHVISYPRNIMKAAPEAWDAIQEKMKSGNWRPCGNPKGVFKL